MSDNKSCIHDLLSRSPLFAELDDDALAAVAQSTTKVAVKRKGMIIQRGDRCNGFHIVVAGKIKVFFASLRSSEKVVQILTTGGSFGEAFMFLEKPHILSAQALTDALILHIPKDAVLALTANDHHFTHKMLVSLSYSLHGLMTDIEAYSLRTASQRVVDYLLQGRDDAGEGLLHLESSKAVIASRLSLTPEHFSRILHDLRVNRVISVKGSAIEILNVEELRRCQSRAP